MKIVFCIIVALLFYTGVSIAQKTNIPKPTKTEYSIKKGQLNALVNSAMKYILQKNGEVITRFRGYDKSIKRGFLREYKNNPNEKIQIFLFEGVYFANIICDCRDQENWIPFSQVEKYLE